MKKILFVFPFAIVGGVETLFSTLIKHLPCGFEYKTLIPQGLNPFWVSVNLDSPLMYRDPQTMAVQIDNYKPDLIVGALNYTLSAAMQKCKKSYRILETSHNVLKSALDSIELVRPHIAHVVCVSQSVQKHISSIYKGPSSIILTGIDTDKFKPRETINPLVKNYAYFGRLSNGDKYVKDLFNTFTRIPWGTLNVYGEAHTPKEQLMYKMSLEREYRGAKISLKGFVTNPEEHFHQNDVIVIRSEAEGFCNTAAEAFACGIPLVTYDFGGVLDHAPDRSCLKSKSQQEFEQHLKLIKEWNIRKELRSNALQFVRSVCNAEYMSRQYFNLFKELLGVEEVVEIKRTVAICTEHSTSIQHAMEDYADESMVIPYENKITRITSQCDKVIINAAGKGYKPLIMSLSKTKKVYAIYHGSFCSFSFDLYQGERENLQTMLDLQNKGYIKKIGFVNEGSAHFYRSLGYNCEWTPNIPMKPRKDLWNKNKLGINIGIFTADQPIKNSIISTSCALSIPNAKIHTIYPINPLPGLTKNNMIVHGRQKKEALLELMSKMDLTIMLSFSESYGMLVTQSMAVNTPCIVGPACKPLLPEDLKGLYVERVDDAHKIMEAINFCLGRTFNFEDHIEYLRGIAFKQRSLFLDNYNNNTHNGS